MTDPFGPHSFTWIAGIEDTCVYPPADFGMLPLNEFDLTDHTINWRADLEAVRDLGGTALRYGVNWPLVHTAPGEFDWSMLDQRLAFATGELGLTVIADLVHYGTPTWLAQSFADPDYPKAVADFAGRFAARYRGMVDHITPLNEPLTTASFCGLRGVWPPALEGWAGWTSVLMGMTAGIRATIAAVREANPDARIVHVEAASIYEASSSELEDHATQLSSLGMLPTDLLLGRVTPSHEQYRWLVDLGADAGALDRFTMDVPTIDLLGINYYPDLTPRTLTNANGAVTQVATNLGPAGLASSIRAFGARYGLPMLLTETSIEGDDDVRVAWVEASASCLDELRADGVDIRGYTWWPIMDFVDWSFASAGRNVEEFVVDDELVRARESVGAASKTPYLRRMGLIRLDEQSDGSLLRTPTPAAERFSSFALRSPAFEADD